MNLVQTVNNSVAEIFAAREEPDGVRLTTHCLYPSNAFVQVVVRGGEDTFYVSDDRGAVDELESAGATIDRPDKLLAQVVKPYGMSISKGAIRSPTCKASELGVAIALVSNASKSAAEWLFQHLRVKPNDNFKEIVSSFLRKTFDSVRSEVLFGKSNKAHKFENIIFLESSKLVIDPVVNDRSSINARVVANMDVMAAHYENIEQRIIYDDREDWRPEDLNLLQAGAKVVAYSNVPAVLSRLSRDK